MTGPRTGMAGSMLPGTAVMSASGNIVGGAGCLGAGVGGGDHHHLQVRGRRCRRPHHRSPEEADFFLGLLRLRRLRPRIGGDPLLVHPHEDDDPEIRGTYTYLETYLDDYRAAPHYDDESSSPGVHLLGRPALLTFDLGRPSFYGEGEFWILKNPQAQIQGRYMGTPFTYGLAAAQKIAIGGPFLQGHTIEVEPMEHAYGGHILVDGEPVLLNFGTYRVGDVATINYDGQGDLPDQAASQWTTRAVHLELPMDIVMTIFRWGNYVDFKLEMSPLPGGQDGSCGNFNGDASDDTTPAIFKRIGARVGRGELLFSHFTDVSFTSEEQSMLNKDCPEGELMAAREKCRGGLLQSATEQQLNACAFDVCFGMNEHALRIAKTYATAEDRAAAHEALA
eukprot:CAMPEP_0177335516 /NCGR_PEP_ID=MMETSP0368-20130122/23293_1 /TAXON_ID=447022 ORGANISM="Scrippsiella hangoei-like, Strain SHHI-4" /NCGR_SAMPLE_ID=MMETSP0368 /ASSEMBLY_ACC=CAM_ASM_000363 /LENGTH=392 /DNA_ID=CAMNT_0018796305 /DNA_START=10 /DNA_END=1189 /DNA_ORIENTATION=-